MVWYIFASFSPAVALVTACLNGGLWAVVALLWVTGFVFLADRIANVLIPLREDAAALRGAMVLNLCLAILHLALVPLAVWTLTQDNLSPGAWIALFLAFGVYFGQVANSNAHELIHTNGRWPRRLGTSVFIALLFGHHVSAHRLVHHVAVASDADPNSARRGESFYHFWPRAWIGSFRAGLQAETRLRQRKSETPPIWTHPYVGYVGGAFLCLALAGVIAGWRGVIVYVVLTGHAQMLLLLADYVQHYGLRRRKREDGTLEPAGLRHSWNATPWYSAAMMLNAPRHSDHHMNPARRFPALRLDPDTMPVLPRSLPVMAIIAMVPPLWRQMMDWRLDAVQSGTDGAARGNLQH